MSDLHGNIANWDKFRDDISSFGGAVVYVDAIDNCCESMETILAENAEDLTQLKTSLINFLQERRAFVKHANKTFD